MSAARVLHRSWERVRELVTGARSIGTSYTIASVCDRLIPNSFFRIGHELLMEIDLHGTIGADREHGELIWAGLDNLDWIVRFKPSALLTRIKRSALQDERRVMGDRVLLFKHDGTLSAYVWFRTGHFKDEVDGIIYTLPSGTVWLFDGRVDTAHRRKGLYKRLLRAAARDLSEAGYSRIVLAVDYLNRNSVRGHLSVGASVIGRVFVIRVLGRGACMAKTNTSSKFNLDFSGPNDHVELLI
jgi:ribosomal protein S18 acetylase RimI-like enzyme